MRTGLSGVTIGRRISISVHCGDVCLFLSHAKGNEKYQLTDLRSRNYNHYKPVPSTTMCQYYCNHNVFY